jgi:hypothetical protein
MTNLLTMKSPRWLGWVLLVAGILDALLWTFLIVVFALLLDESWFGVAGDIYALWFALWLIGVLSAVAGIRILRGTSHEGAAVSS